MKFCNKYSLEKLAQNPTEHAQYLNKAYKWNTQNL
jgi:hypothetical protein